jgi:hypothetical protein
LPDTAARFAVDGPGSKGSAHKLRLRQQIRNYYGDPLGTGVSPADSNYANEAESDAAAGERWLGASHQTQGTRAIVLDVADTTLLTWNYEIFSNWAFNPTTNAQFVTDQKFPAVFGMVDLANTAEREGYAVFFLTGRPAAQETATLGNLTADGISVDAGYPKPTTLSDGEDGLFTKPAVADYPDYLRVACANDPNGSCTTTHYKTATRAHIESLGYDIVANFGDQFSDLTGGLSTAPEIHGVRTGGGGNPVAASWAHRDGANPNPSAGTAG